MVRSKQNVGLSKYFTISEDNPRVNQVRTSQAEYRRDHHTEEVAFTLSQEAQNVLVSWEAAEPRLIYMAHSITLVNGALAPDLMVFK